MEGFFFGESGRQLYGVFHGADPAAYQSRSVLLLYPVGQEYMRIHRAYRRLADSLSDLGFDVLRFDYPGTGDSSGDFSEASLASWKTGAIQAYDELQTMAPSAQVDVVALRVGTIVARALVRERRVARLVLWEPRFEDAAYLRDFTDAIAAKGPTRPNFVADDGSLHYNGFRFASELQAELSHGSLADLEPRRVRSILALSTHDLAEDPALNRLFNRNDNWSVMQTEGPDDWSVLDSVGGLFLPEASLETIRHWLSQ
jgi:pimeloyl-ACP methyl ester carboxylesterase